MKKALFIGRFQPFHNAHLSDVKEAVNDNYEVIIGIGSSQKSNTKLNPFSYEERKEMIQDTLKDNYIEDYKIIAVPDINDDRKWVEHVKKIIPCFKIVYTGNNHTEELFKEKKIPVKKIRLIKGINATAIRKRITKSNNWKELVPKAVVEYVCEDNRGTVGMQ